MNHTSIRHVLRSLPALLAAMMSCSCVQRVPYKPGTVRTASLSAITPPLTMTFETKGQSVQRDLGERIAPLGVAGALVGGSMEESAVKASQHGDEAMRRFYSQEVRRIMTEEIAARGQFKVVNDPQADAVLQVSCGEWGLRYIAGGAYSGKVGAIATLNCVMKDHSGRVIWDDNAFHIHQGKTARMLSGEESWRIQWFGYSRNYRQREDFVGHPDLIRQELSASIRHRARQIASSLPEMNAPVAAR